MSFFAKLRQQLNARVVASSNQPKPFEVTVMLNDVFHVETFEEAWKKLYTTVMQKAEAKERISEQLLFDATWIVEKRGDETRFINFMAASEKAYELGLMKEGRPTWS